MFSNMSKIKVVWICHFSNEDIRKMLPLTKKGLKVSDFAPWISGLIKEFKTFQEVELHVISPHVGLKVSEYSFTNDGVKYYFYQADIPNVSRYILSIYYRVDAWTGYIIKKNIVKRLINNIKPDIINLIGAENPYYSSTVLGIKNYPILVSIQGIYSNPRRFDVIKKEKVRYYTERKIHSENKYFAINASFMEDLIKRDSDNAILFWNRYPINVVKIKKEQNTDKIYDFVLFSRLTSLKGTEDALKAMAIVAKKMPEVTMRMMGIATKERIQELKNKAITLGIEKNVFITEGYALHEELLQEALKARYYILPTKLDTIPSTIFEAIYLDLPVISYNTGDIPLLNKGDVRVLLSDKEDIESLANNMILLLSNPELGVQIREKAKMFVEKWFDNRRLALNFLDQYKAVLANYYNMEDIPKSLLYENYLKDI
jgi:glycosyltransferase involved in cell wall biosynthesis